MNKLISIFLSLVLIATYPLNAHAATNTTQSGNNILITDNVIQTLPSDSQIDLYSKYSVDLDALLNANSRNSLSIMDTILSHCTLTSTNQVGNYQVSSYTPNTLSSYLYNCQRIKNIELIDCYLYIFYRTTDGLDVAICYNDQGLYEHSIYTEANDTAFINSGGNTYLYQNYRAGVSYEMTDEFENEIDELIRTENWGELENLNEINVSIDDYGFVSIEPNLSSNSRASDFTNESDLLSHLKSRFAPYDGTLKATFSRYSYQLNSNISIRVTETRNTYTKKTASWQTFAIGTGLTAIATFLGLSTIDPVIAILTALSVGISAAQTILDAVKLYNSAVYKYNGYRTGYAYDTTLHNAYVNVVEYSGKGEFTGGYTADGVFDWVHSTISSAYSHEYSDIADTVRYYYDSELITNGICITYTPD